MAMEKDQIDARRLFFSSHCFSSPFITDAFPEVIASQAEAFYNPIIDATFLPLSSKTLAEEKQNPGMLTAHMFLEEGHRVLSSATSMCQMRVVAALVHELILSLIPNGTATTQVISKEQFYTAFSIYHRVLNQYFDQSRVLQEAFALYTTVRRFQARHQSTYSAEYAPDHIESKCLASLGDQPEFHQILPIYHQLRKIEERFSRPGFVTRIVGAALNIPWPPILNIKYLDSLKTFPIRLLHEVELFFQKPNVQPMTRFKTIMQLVNRFPLVGLYAMSDDELDSAICNLHPDLASYLMDPCDNNCHCVALFNDLERLGIWPDNLTALGITLELSRNIKNQVQKTGSLSSDAIRLGWISQDDIRKFEYYLAFYPNWFISDDTCLLKEELYKGGALEAIILQTSLESIRQQLSQSIFHFFKGEVKLISPWNRFQFGLLSPWGELLVITFGAKFNLFHRIQEAINKL